MQVAMVACVPIYNIDHAGIMFKINVLQCTSPFMHVLCECIRTQLHAHTYIYNIMHCMHFPEGTVLHYIINIYTFLIYYYIIILIYYL